MIKNMLRWGFNWCLALAASFCLAAPCIAASTSTNYSAQPGLFASGGGQGSSTNYQQPDALAGLWFAQVDSSSANYQSGDDATPTALAFVDQTGAALSTQITSAPVQITGINIAANWTATSGTACVSSANNCACNVAAHAASGTIANNQYLCTRHTSSASYSTATNTLITIGAMSDTFTSTTLAADTTPNAFTFVDQSGVALSATITSAPVQIGGINAAANWTATGGTACVSSGNNCSCGAAYAASGTVTNSQYLCAQHTASASAFAATNTLVTVGGVSDTFTSTTLATPVSGSSISGSTGAGMASASAAGGGNGAWLFAAAGSGPLQSAGFIPLSGHPKSPPVAPPAGVSFPYGLLDFVLAGGQAGSTATLTITYPAALPPGTVYWKYGPTPGPVAAHWYTIPATITGNTVTINITDGGLGDDDLTANGTIVDAGGVGVQAQTNGAVAIPTLSEWGLVLLAGMLGLFGMGAMRRYC